MVTITIAGKEYPMSFSVMAAKKIAAKHGSVEKFIAEFNNVDGIGEREIDEIISVIELLISQGCAYKNYFEKDVPTKKADPVIDGKWTPLPKEALEIAIGLCDFEEIAEKIMKCINKDKKGKIEQVNTSKNVEAGQE